MTTTFQEQATVIMELYNHLKKEEFGVNFVALNDIASTISMLSFLESSLKEKAIKAVSLTAVTKADKKLYAFTLNGNTSIDYSSKEEAIKACTIYLMEQKLAAL